MHWTIVTGAQGFLGRRLVARLAAKGGGILAVDRQARIGPPLPGVVYHLSDLAQADTLIPPVCEPVTTFDLIHLAWDLRNRETSYRTQSEDVTRLAGLLDSWTARGLARLIAPGSAQEYGARPGVLAEDDEPVEPLSPYGWAKHACHAMAVSWAQRTGKNLVWLRPFIIYGPGQAGSMLVPYAFRQALAGAPAKVTDGEQLRDFVYVDDVIEAILLALRKPTTGILAANLGGGVPVRVRDVLEEICRLCGSKDVFQFGALPRRPGEPDMQVACCDRAAATLGWKPQVAWRAGLARIQEQLNVE